MSSPCLAIRLVIRSVSWCTKAKDSSLGWLISVAFPNFCESTHQNEPEMRVKQTHPFIGSSQRFCTIQSIKQSPTRCSARARAREKMFGTHIHNSNYSNHDGSHLRPRHPKRYRSMNRTASVEKWERYMRECPKVYTRNALIMEIRNASGTLPEPSNCLIASRCVCDNCR